ncbi:glycosyltransferase [Pasteurellaceae bacterium 15-036681]|nr:glycosyltransferase [Pasteurellaceae bacterium 15-036681]
MSITRTSEFPLSVAVITSTIGRSHLERAIQSVQQQNYPCKHYVFVDGEQYFATAKAILDKYPHIIPIYLPMNTGAGGWTNSSINAIAPFLVKEDIMCYLDDDNWYEPNHIESGVATLLASNADYAYSLRYCYMPELNKSCPDVNESIANYNSSMPNPFVYTISFGGKQITMTTTQNKINHIDTNCFFVKRDIAVDTASNWVKTKQNDTYVFEKFLEIGLVGCCTGQFSVQYLLDLNKYDIGFINTCKMNFENITDLEIKELFYQKQCLYYQVSLENWGGIFPWNRQN